MWPTDHRQAVGALETWAASNSNRSFEPNSRLSNNTSILRQATRVRSQRPSVLTKHRLFSQAIPPTNFFIHRPSTTPTHVDELAPAFSTFSLFELSLPHSTSIGCMHVDGSVNSHVEARPPDDRFIDSVQQSPSGFHSGC